MQYTQLSRRSAGGKIDWEKQYLTFIPVEDAVFSWAERAVSGHLEYSVNGGQTWVTIADGESTPTITAGSKVMWRGDLVPSTVSDSQGIGTFSATGLYDACGNTMSLLYGDNYVGQTTLVGTCTFYSLWSGDTCIYRADRMVLPAKKITRYCYWNMFYGCTSLVTAPELPATKLATQCYFRMFYGCTSLVTAPELLAKSLVTDCYAFMFYGCTSLVTAPELPATTLVYECYASMFRYCTSLVYVKMLATDITAKSCLSNWLSDVSATGTFVKHSQMTTLPTGASGIPDGWTVVDDNS